MVTMLVMLAATVWLGWLTWAALHVAWPVAFLVAMFLPYVLWGLWLAIRKWRRPTD